MSGASRADAAGVTSTFLASRGKARVRSAKDSYGNVAWALAGGEGVLAQRQPKPTINAT